MKTIRWAPARIATTFFAALRCAAAGKAVLVEKPMALDAAEMAPCW